MLNNLIGTKVAVEIAGNCLVFTLRETLGRARKVKWPDCFQEEGGS